jgi:hypothetical protein
VVSLPHFYLADEEYQDGVVGLNPTQEEHEIMLLFEPVGELCYAAALSPACVGPNTSWAGDENHT